MSRGTLFVRFPDGSVRYGIYNGNSDVASPGLYSTPEEAWDRDDAGETADWKVDPASRPMAVQVATNYGGGFAWVGAATPDLLTEGRDPGETDDGIEHGLPEWTSGRRAE